MIFKIWKCLFDIYFFLYLFTCITSFFWLEKGEPRYLFSMFYFSVLDSSWTRSSISNPLSYVGSLCLLHCIIFSTLLLGGEKEKLMCIFLAVIVHETITRTRQCSLWIFFFSWANQTIEHAVRSFSFFSFFFFIVHFGHL